jgi:hypothetical protein
VAAKNAKPARNKLPWLDCLFMSIGPLKSKKTNPRRIRQDIARKGRTSWITLQELISF